jgi:hypothetical protein
MSSPRINMNLENQISVNKISKKISLNKTYWMVEGSPGIVTAIMEFIVKKEMSSSWFHNSWIRKHRKMFKGVVRTKLILPPSKYYETDLSIPYTFN